MKERGFALAAIAAVAILVDCGGGGGGGAVAPTTVSAGGSGTSNSASYAKATFSITVPKGATTSATTRKPQLVTSNTVAITFTLIGTTASGVATGTPSAVFPLTATSPGCSATANGVTCSLAISAPVGTDAYLANVYSSTTATAGTQTGSGAVQITVQANAANTASLSLNGPITNIALTTNCPFFNSLTVNGACVVGSFSDFIGDTGFPANFFGTPPPASNFFSPLRIYAIASDANGNEIVAPTVYDQPITLALEPAVGSLSLTLGVSYSSASLAETNGATSASVTSNGATIQIWSPLDAISLTLTPGSTGAFEGYIFSGIGTSVAPIPLGTFGASPNPNATPGPYLLVGGASLGSAGAPTPTPAPTPVPTGPLSWTNSSNYSGSNGNPAFRSVTLSTTNPTQYSLEFPLPTPAPVTVGLASNFAFGGSYTITDGGEFPGCVATNVIGAIALPTSVPALGAAGAAATVSFSLITGTNATCSITASDGTNTSDLDIIVDNPSVIIQQRKRK